MPWILIYGALDTGVEGAVGPFADQDEAIEYGESHNLGHPDSKVPMEIEEPDARWRKERPHTSQLLTVLENMPDGKIATLGLEDGTRVYLSKQDGQFVLDAPGRTINISGLELREE